MNALLWNQKGTDENWTLMNKYFAFTFFTEKKIFATRKKEGFLFQSMQCGPKEKLTQMKKKKTDKQTERQVKKS